MEQNLSCPKHGNECHDVLRIMEILEKMFEPKDVDQWLGCPNPELSGKTPRQAVNDGFADKLRDAMEAALMGVTS